MIQMIHCSGTGLGVRCQVVEPSLAKQQGWGRSVPAPVWLPIVQPANHGCTIQVTMSFPWPRAERSWRQPVLSLSSAQSLIRTDEIIRTWFRRMLAKRDCGALTTHMARLQRRWARECCWRRGTGGLGGLPGGGGIGTQQNGLGSEPGPASTKDTEQQALTITWQTGAAHPALSKLCWPCPGHPSSALSSEVLGLWKGGGEPSEFLGSC